MKRKNEKGYTFVEMMSVMVIIGLLAAGSMTYLRGSSIVVVGRMTQVAMANLASEQPNMKYPTSVTIADIESHGVGSLLDDYVVDSYARTGTPTGSNYKLELKAPDGTILCLTESTFTRVACPA